MSSDNHIDHLVILDDVFVAYETVSGKIMALRGVDLIIDFGDTIVINGPSGSGKTTLLKLIMGAIKPVSGKVLVFGLDPFVGDNVYKIRRNIGYCSQEGLFIKQLTIRENIKLYLHGRNKRISKDEIKNLASRLGITKVLDKFPYQLSGGELKRAELLMILVDKPKLLLLDEPTAMLDAENVDRVIEVLNEFKEQSAMIIATHDTRLSKIGDKLIELVGGRIIKIHES